MLTPDEQKRAKRIAWNFVHAENDRLTADNKRLRAEVRRLRKALREHRQRADLRWCICRICSGCRGRLDEALSSPRATRRKTK